MKLFISLFLLSLGFFSDPELYTYEVDCGSDAQWVNGKNYCNVHNESMFVTASYEAMHETYNTFQIKIQNIGNDTLLIDPQQFLLIRTFENGSTDTVQILNVEKEILKATADVAKYEKEISDLTKLNNTQNDLSNTLRLFTRNGSSSAGNTAGNAKNVLYQEQLKLAQTKLTEATTRKNYWTTEALRKNSVYPYSYTDKKIWANLENCSKARICIPAQQSMLYIPFKRVSY